MGWSKPHLRHRLEQPARETLLLGLDDARDEDGAGGEDKVRTEDGEDGGGEAVRPVGRGGDEGEEDGGTGGYEGAGGYSA